MKKCVRQWRKRKLALATRSTVGQETNQALTSVSWVSRIEDARESLLRSHWDLVIVDEAHKMSAYSAEHKTLAHQLGEALGELADHYLLLTATPPKGDPANFALFLALLDRDVYGNAQRVRRGRAADRDVAVDVGIAECRFAIASHM